VTHSNHVSDIASSIQERQIRYDGIVRKFSRKEQITQAELEQVRDLNALCFRDIDSDPTLSIDFAVAFAVQVHCRGFGWMLHGQDMCACITNRYRNGDPPHIDELTTTIRHWSRITQGGKDVEDKVFLSMQVLLHFIARVLLDGKDTTSLLKLFSSAMNKPVVMAVAGYKCPSTRATILYRNGLDLKARPMTYDRLVANMQHAILHNKLRARTNKVGNGFQRLSVEDGVASYRFAEFEVQVEAMIEKRKSADSSSGDVSKEVLSDVKPEILCDPVFREWLKHVIEEEKCSERRAKFEMIQGIVSTQPLSEGVRSSCAKKRPRQEIRTEQSRSSQSSTRNCRFRMQSKECGSITRRPKFVTIGPFKNVTD
jgi:hypothetical protein